MRTEPATTNPTPYLIARGEGAIIEGGQGLVAEGDASPSPTNGFRTVTHSKKSFSRVIIKEN